MALSRKVSFTNLPSAAMLTILQFSCTFDRAVALLQSLNSISQRFLREGVEPMLLQRCFRDPDEKTLMECVASIRPLKVMPVYQFDLQWPTTGQAKEFLAKLIKE